MYLHIKAYIHSTIEWVLAHYSDMDFCVHAITIGTHVSHPDAARYGKMLGEIVLIIIIHTVSSQIARTCHTRRSTGFEDIALNLHEDMPHCGPTWGCIEGCFRWGWLGAGRTGATGTRMVPSVCVAFPRRGSRSCLTACTVAYVTRGDE